MIDTNHKLSDLLPRLSAASWIAVDTEADSLHAYPEKLCLLQISLADGDELIDPLAPIDLSPLLEQFRRHELIMHGADYDLRLLFRTYRFAPKAIFDTMLAARLLGFNEFGLTHLVGGLLGVPLEKGPQKADWARRPLTERMALYARNDTRYLKPLADSLRVQLEQKQRLDWHRETCARLIEDCTMQTRVDPDQIWRIKGADRLDRRGLAVLREIWTWRDQEAVAANRPPFFILNHELLVMVASAASQDRPFEQLLPPRLSPHRRKGVVSALHRALALPADDWPQPNRRTGRRITRAERERCEKLRSKRDQAATTLGIDPSLIANRATLVELAVDWERKITELMNWQRKLLEG